MSYNRKPIPTRILIFGASGHIGGPLATFLTREAPSIGLRLASSDETRAAELRKAFPAAEVVVADYSEPASLLKAVDRMEGVFVVTPAGTDERMATTNLVEALKASGSLVHLIRLVAIYPDANPRRIPPSLAFLFQHSIAKQILDESDLPVTYLNCGATFMDNFLRRGQAESIRRERKFVWPERLVPWIDTRDIGEVAGHLLLSDNHRHIGQLHTINNGHDLLRFHQVAELLSEVLGEPVSYDSSKEAFFATYAQLGPIRQLIWDFLQYEQDNEVIWSRNDFVERTLGRKPTTLREWLIEHRDAILKNQPAS